MSCCESATALSRKDFLESKLKNFRAFIEPHCTTDELKTKLAEFQDLDTVMPYLGQLLALVKVGGQEAIEPAVASFLSSFPAASQSDEKFTAKVRRYIEMFVEVLTC